MPIGWHAVPINTTATKTVSDLLVQVLAEVVVERIYGVSGDSLNGMRCDEALPSGEACVARRITSSKACRHRGTLVIEEANRLLLLSDQNAYTGPTIMRQSRRRSRAQGHQPYILCFEWIPCFEVVPHNLCAVIGPGKSVGCRRGV
jgi:hypothetical protein